MKWSYDLSLITKACTIQTLNAKLKLLRRKKIGIPRAIGQPPPTVPRQPCQRRPHPASKVSWTKRLTTS